VAAITIGNGQGRVVDHVDGIVASSNARGIKLRDRDDYLNFSRFADPPIAPPRRGANVRLGLDADGYIRQLEDLEPGPAVGTDRERLVTRLAVLKAAANFLGLMGQAREEVRSEHVLVLADKWLAWVQQEDGA
jgi:hypothetical protein